MTAREALREGAAALSRTETPFLDASLLLAEALGTNTSRLIASLPDAVGEAEIERYRASLASRAAGVPVAYILGYKEFWGRRFAVDKRVLVPRPDTETLVEASLRIGDALARERVTALKLGDAVAREKSEYTRGKASTERSIARRLARSIREITEGKPREIHGNTDDRDDVGFPEKREEVALSSSATSFSLLRDLYRAPCLSGSSCLPSPRLRVHEVCTGSGCVAISLAAERPDWAVSASDISEDALEVARANAARHIAAERQGGAVDFYRSDLLSAAAAEGAFDLILANPPYVPAAEAGELLSQGWSEPLGALDGGEDGLDLIRRLVPEAALALAPGGALLVEADGGQADEVGRLFRASRLTEVGTLPDLAGIPRVTTGRKPWTS